MERVLAILIEIQRQGYRRDELLFEQPRLSRRKPDDQGVLRHPFGEPLLAIGKGPPPPAADAPERDAEQASQRESQRRTFGVATVVIANPPTQVLTARQLLRGDADIEQGRAKGLPTVRRGHSRRNLAEVPGVHAGLARHGAVPRPHHYFGASPEPCWVQKGVGLRCNVSFHHLTGKKLKAQAETLSSTGRTLTLHELITRTLD